MYSKTNPHSTMSTQKSRYHHSRQYWLVIGMSANFRSVGHVATGLASQWQENSGLWPSVAL